MSIASPNFQRLSVSGMTCQNCVRHATEALQGVHGVERVRIDLDSGSAEILWHSDSHADVDALLLALDKVGFKGKPESLGKGMDQERGPGKGVAGWSLNLLIGLPVFVLMMISEWGLDLGANSTYRTVSLILASIILWIAGGRFYKGAWQQLKRGKSNMDTLVSLGATAAYLFSVWGWYFERMVHLYFMETVGILTLISLGHWLEARMSSKASYALKSLIKLSPQRARKRQSDGTFVLVDVSEIRMGDHVELQPGDQIPTDGVVIEGSSALDESMLTGESMPVEKTTGDQVYAATFNQQGRLLVRVTGLGEDTALARIIKVVEHAQHSRANIQKLGDRVSSIFVPIVVLVALATMIGWGFWPEGMGQMAASIQPYLWEAHVSESVLAAAVIHGVAVLIVACPCAMGLATPAAIMAGTNAAAARGILIRDGEALEKSGRITALAFDKTGTLTEGKPSVVDFRFFSNVVSESEVRRMAISMSSQSNHPLSRAIAASGMVKEGEVTPLVQWTEHTGMGIHAFTESSEGEATSGKWMLGSLAWLEKSGVSLKGTEDFQMSWSQKGATVIGLASGSHLMALIALQDTLKPHAAEMIRRLHSHGWDIHLITGDHQRTGQAVVEQLGMDPSHLHAEVKPDEKAGIIQALQKRGERVAFVGDGINDAPALEQADLGIAVTRASDIAREASDIVLLQSDIQAIPEALQMAKATLRTIKQNLFWAFFYNAAAIPLAMFGFMSPLLCAAAMGFSDVLVIGNALRLRFK